LNPRPIALDEIDLLIISELQKDCRKTFSQLARKAKMSAPAVSERVERLKEFGVIAGFQAVIDPKAIGLAMSAFVRVRPMPGQLQKVIEKAKRMDQVTECHRITGEDCLMLRIHFDQIDTLDQILDEFTPIGQTTTSIVQSSPVPSRPVPLPTPNRRSRRKTERGIEG
jgi:Lrp/AsnC family transcriptional regulator, leucine-responsive regulatory protein